MRISEFKFFSCTIYVYFYAILIDSQKHLICIFLQIFPDLYLFCRVSRVTQKNITKWKRNFPKTKVFYKERLSQLQKKFYNYTYPHGRSLTWSHRRWKTPSACSGFASVTHPPYSAVVRKNNRWASLVFTRDNSHTRLIPSIFDTAILDTNLLIRPNFTYRVCIQSLSNVRSIFTWHLANCSE